MLNDCIIESVSLDELNPAPYNPRTITEEALEGLSNSLQKFGTLVPIIWNKRTGNIVGGHQRYKVLKRNGEKEAQVVVVDLDDEKEIALNIVLNSNTVRGDFTQDIILQLQKARVDMGSEFEKINLDSLLDDMKSMKWDSKDKDGKKDNEPNKEDFEGEFVNLDEDSGVDDDEDIVKTLITCPECQSRWDIATNKVVENKCSE